MSPWRAGKFERKQVGWPLRNLAPDESAHDLAGVDLAALHARGKRLVLLDVDNTLLPWRSEDIPQDTIDWIEGGKRLGLTFCIISNTRKPARLGRLAARLGVPYLRGKFKPSRAMYLQALEEFGVRPEEAVMVGDQLFTDVLGANRSGVESIWVKPMGRREFVGTKVNRAFEQVVRRLLYRYLEEVEVAPPDTATTTFWDRRIVRQFVKFCIVGGSSFVIDAGIHKYLMFYAPYAGGKLSQAAGRWLVESGLYLRGDLALADAAHNASSAYFKVLSATIAILNSFVWNRRWTFKIKGKEDRGKQLFKFLILSFAGMGLNVLIFSLVNRTVPGTEEHRWLVATLVATAVVAVWNFTGQRLWALKRTEP